MRLDLHERCVAYAVQQAPALRGHVLVTTSRGADALRVTAMDGDAVDVNAHGQFEPGGPPPWWGEDVLVRDA